MPGEVERYEEPKPEGWFGFIHINDERYELTRDNTSVWTHLGQLALYNHVHLFVENEGEKGSVYLFEAIPSQSTAYEAIAQTAVNKDCQAFLNMRSVMPQDQESFKKALEYDTQMVIDSDDDDDFELPDNFRLK